MMPPFPLVRRGGIQPRLKQRVQRLCPRRALARRRDYLNLVERADAVGRRQARRANIGKRRNQRVAAAAHEEKILVTRIEQRHFPAIDAVSTGDNQAFAALTENLGQTHRIESAAVNQIMQNIACADARQLVAVAEQYETRARSNGGKQRIGQKHIHHRSLVDDNNVRVEQVVLIPYKDRAILILTAEFHLKQTMNRPRLAGCRLRHTLCRASGRRSKRHLTAHALINAN